MADQSTQQNVAQLNAGWYDIVTTAMGITDPNFQLAQGTFGLQTTDSSGLFLVADSVPPTGKIFATSTGRRSAAFNLLLEALIPEGGRDLQGALADQFTSWIAFKKAWYANAANDPTTKQERVFAIWSNQTLDPRKAAQAMNVFAQADNTPLNQASDAMRDPNNKTTFTDQSQQTVALYRYSGSIEGARRALDDNGQKASLKFDSSTMNRSTTRTVVDWSAGGMFDFFSGGASGSFDQLSMTAASKGLHIEGTIDKHATLITAPAGWYSSAEVSRALHAKNDNRIWDPESNAGDWDSFFGPSGSLARAVTQIYLVSGYDITVTSAAQYSDVDFQMIQARASGGMWPFCSASASTTHQTTFVHNADGSLSAHHTLNPGQIQVWGVSFAPPV
jgi:hypothetical protein